MTPKEKAKELVELYCQLLSIRSYENKNKAKQCAIIVVDEMKSEINRFADNNYRLERMFYLDKVKEEIEKL